MKRSMIPLFLCLPLATLSVGCGPAGQQFHGEYAGPITYTVNINGRGSSTQTLQSMYRIYEGIDADLIIMNPVDGCAMPANVEKDVATIKPGTTCSAVAGSSTVTNTITSGTAILTGRALQLNVSSTLAVTIDGQSHPGTYIQNVSLTRIGK